MSNKSLSFRKYVDLSIRSWPKRTWNWPSQIDMLSCWFGNWNIYASKFIIIFVTWSDRRVWQLPSFNIWCLVCMQWCLFVYSYLLAMHTICSILDQWDEWVQVDNWSRNCHQRTGSTASDATRISSLHCLYNPVWPRGNLCLSRMKILRSHLSFWKVMCSALPCHGQKYLPWSESNSSSFTTSSFMVSLKCFEFCFKMD